jgi:hypothetical protein
MHKIGSEFLTPQRIAARTGASEPPDPLLLSPCGSPTAGYLDHQHGHEEALEGEKASFVEEK